MEGTFSAKIPPQVWQKRYALCLYLGTFWITVYVALAYFAISSRIWHGITPAQLYLFLILLPNWTLSLNVVVV